MVNHAVIELMKANKQPTRLVSKVFTSLQNPIAGVDKAVDGLHHANHHKDWSEHLQHLRDEEWVI